MNHVPIEILRHVIDLLDFGSLVKSTLLCKRWSETVIDAYEKKWKHHLSKTERVESLCITLHMHKDYYGGPMGDIAFNTNCGNLNAQTLFMPRQLYISYDLDMDDQLLYERCLRVLPLWWTKTIKEISLRQFPISLCQQLLKRFPRQELVLIYSDVYKQREDINMPTVWDMQQLLLTGNCFNMSITDLRFNDLVLLDDTTLRCIMSNISSKPMGDLHLNMLSNVSSRVLIHFIHVVACSEYTATLVGNKTSRKVEMFRLDVRCKERQFLDFCYKKRNRNVDFNYRTNNDRYTVHLLLRDTRFSLNFRMIPENTWKPAAVELASP